MTRVNAMTCGSNGPRRLLSCALFLAAGVAVSACSSAGTSTGTAEPGATSRFAGVFASAPVSASQAAPGAPAFNPSDCPQVDVRTGAGSLSVSAKADDGAATDVRYLLSVNQLARQCTQVGADLVMKIGVEGRIVLGPAGAPGQVDVPLRYAVIREGVAPKTITTKFKRFAAEVPTGQSSWTFSDVEDGVSFPMPSHTELSTYVVYVGFDELGDGAEKKPAAKKPAAKRQ